MGWLPSYAHVNNHLKMSSVSLYHCKKIVLVLIGFSLSVSRFLLTLFSSIVSAHFRFQGNGISQKNVFEKAEAISNENVKEECNLENSDVGDSLNDTEGKLESSFTFKFPAFDEFIISKTEKDEFFCSDFVYSPATRYEFTRAQSVRKFVEQEQVVNLDVKHFNGDSCDCIIIEHDECDDDKKADGSSNKVVHDEEKSENSETSHFIEEPEEFAEKYQMSVKNQECSHVLEDSDSWEDHTIKSHLHGFLSDVNFNEESNDLLDKESSSNIEIGSDFLIEEQFQEDCVINKGNGVLCDSKNNVANNSCNFVDDNKLESLWEHQDLIEQLKMELKKVKATGLPTILEESESPKITQDLKPWKIDETFQHEDCMDELHKLYKIYTERMRKLDVFNYQKMYAIGFLQLKDPFQSIPRPKTSSQMLKFKLSVNFKKQKHNKVNESDPIEKFIKEIQSDLEVVYVGHMCLSWELLHWQYGKALDLWESDTRGIHGYNEVAGEFQQFQVLIQRFIEDEPFQEPRVQHYIKNRCVNRNLLQVPLIREDSYGNRRNKRKSEGSEYVITSYQLVEIIEDSIRTLWRFIRADKDTYRLISKGYRGSSPMQQLQNSCDLELLNDIRNLLHKKEKKLKEMKNGNCILRRLQVGCREEEDSEQVLYNFFLLVDIKLVRRVLNMWKISSEQLVWCHTKLNRISFEPRYINPVECSFSPFPC